MSIIFTSAMFWNAPVDSKGRTKKVVTRVTPMPGFSLVSNEEPQLRGMVGVPARQNRSLTTPGVPCNSALNVHGGLITYTT